MTEKEWKALEEYVRECADMMGLCDWDVVVKREPCDVDAHAQVTPTAGRQRAVVQIAWDFREEAPEQQRYTVIHELTHLHFANAQHTIELDLAQHPALNDHEHQFVWRAFLRQLEYGVDGVARAWACDFPLIEWPK